MKTKLICEKCGDKPDVEFILKHNPGTTIEDIKFCQKCGSNLTTLGQLIGELKEIWDDPVKFKLFLETLSKESLIKLVITMHNVIEGDENN